MQLRYLKTVHQPTPENKDGPKFQKITAIAFSPNHYRLAVATVDRYILLYDENGDLQDRFPTKPAEKTTGPKGYIVRALEFSPDSTRLAVAQSDNIVFVYKLGTKFQDRKSIVNKFQQSAPVTAMCWPINQPNTLAYGSADGKVRIGDLNNNKSIPMYSHDSYVVSMAAGPDGHSLVCAHVDGSIFTYKFEDSDGKFGASHSLLTQVNFVPYALGWGHQICVAGNTGRVQFFDTNGTQRQVFDYSKERDVREFTCAAFNPSGQTVVLGNFNRFHTYAYDTVQGEWHEIAPTRVENMYTMTAVRWKADGSRLVTGSLGGFVDVYDACIRRYVYNGKFEMTYTSPSSAIVRRLSGSGRLELKSAYGCDIRKISVHADRFVLGRTAETLMLADLDTSRVSEIAWSGSGSERFFFDNPSLCMVFNAGELTLVEYGKPVPLGACRTEYVNPHLISVRLCETRRKQGSNGSRVSEDIKRIAYLLDLQTIRLLDLNAQQTVATIALDSKIDWLELNPRGDKLLFRDKRRALHLYDLTTSTRTSLLSFCDYVQWVPDSDVVVAQNRNMLCIWYAIDHPDQVTLVPIKGEVEEIERTHGRTEVIVDEGISRVHYALDESLIAFGSAVEDGEYERAVDILEANASQSPEAPAMWSRLATLSLADGDYRVAERCYIALGDVARARFLRSINQISADPRHPLVQARIAVLNRQFKRAEALLLEQGRVDDAILMYKELHQWDAALAVAQLRGHPQTGQLRQQYFEWLERTGQEDKAGELKEAEGDHMAAITLYLRGARPGKAALLMQTTRVGISDAALIDRVAAALLKSNQHERAGDFFESLDRLDRALDAYTRGKCYRPAVELARRAFPAKVVRLEEDWGDHLASLKQWDAACNHFIECGAHTKAIGAAIEARQWSKASQVLESVDIEMARPHLRKIATHYSETRNFRMAERYYLQGGMTTEVVKMYLTNSLWDEARKCADRALTVEQSSMLYEQQAAAMEAAGKFAEAERLYLEVNEPDLAINMYKKQRMFDRMLTLVGKWRKELLNDTHLHLARQFESENDFKMAEQHFVAAKDWKSAVQLYREHQLWDDALRVAKAHGGLGAYKQVAYASAVSLGGEAGIKMLAKRGLAELAIEYAIERGEFPEAFHIAEQAARQKLPEVHLQYAMSLEDAGRFDKAEEEFLMAGKPKEAVDMYIHQHEWQNALRVATQHDPSAVPSIREAQARDAMERKDFHTAEQHFAGAQKLELAVDMYKNAGMWDDAIRVARQAAPHAVHELQSEHAQYMATVAPNQPELVLNQVKQMLKVGQSHEAIDALLRITTHQSDNPDFLLRAWEQAVQIALEHQPARALEVVSIVARRMSELGRHDAAAQAWVAVEDYRQAVDSYLAAGNFAKARTLAQTSAPHLLDGVERAAQRAGQANSAPGYGFGSIGSGSMSAPAPMVSSANTEASLETLAARGDFERVFELCAQSNVETSMIQRFAIMHAAKLVQEEKYSNALQTLVQHGAPAVAVNVPIFRRVTQEILAHTGDSGSESQLRELLYKLVTAFKESSSIPPTVTKEFERYLLIAHSLAMKAQHKRLGLLQLHARACMSLLRFTTDVAVDQAFHDAGQACREVGWHSNAFVYFNRFVDLCDLIDNPESGDIENADFAGTDIPSPFDVPLPAKPAYDAASREEIREWVVDQAISNEANAQALSTRPCEKCSKQVAEATITCPHCKHEHTPCIVTGFPVPKSSKVACKACKLFASKDDWNTFVVKTKVCPWCGTQANAVY